MKRTPHKVVVGRQSYRVYIDGAGRFTVKVKGFYAPSYHTNRFGHRKTPGGVSITTYRERSLWQLERSMHGLPTGTGSSQ